MRINRYFSDQGYCSRREADRLIEAQRVKINGRVAVLGDKVNDDDVVELDGKKILFNPPKKYIMYNKPRGITCTTDLKIEGNIIQAVNYSQRIYPIGRLDKESTGLIFLTNDGDIVNKILRAQFGHEKEYNVEINAPVTTDFLVKMRSGVDIGDHLTKKCVVEKIGPNKFKIILTEGKNRQIRRMCEVCGTRVKNLHRVRIMNVRINDLKAGEWKEIPDKDFQELLKQLSLKDSEFLDVEE
jgi:23S rRNA pseudouridine2604 synthase